MSDSVSAGLIYPAVLSVHTDTGGSAVQTHHWACSACCGLRHIVYSPPTPNHSVLPSVDIKSVISHNTQKAKLCSAATKGDGYQHPPHTQNQANLALLLTKGSAISTRPNQNHALLQRGGDQHLIPRFPPPLPQQIQVTDALLRTGKSRYLPHSPTPSLSITIEQVDLSEHRQLTYSPVFRRPVLLFPRSSHPLQPYSQIKNTRSHINQRH